MKRNAMKLFAALACATVVASAYAACYTYGYGVVVPYGATKNVWVSCNGTYSTIVSADQDWTATDYRFTPPTPGNYWDPDTKTLYIYWVYTDCNAQTAYWPPTFDDPQSYPSVDLGQNPNCPYP